MQAFKPSVAAKGPIFDLTLLVKGIKSKSLNSSEAKNFSLSLCSTAKSILLLALDQADNYSVTRICSQSELQDALYASASLIELAEFVVAETESHHE